MSRNRFRLGASPRPLSKARGGTSVRASDAAIEVAKKSGSLKWIESAEILRDIIPSWDEERGEEAVANTGTQR